MDKSIPYANIIMRIDDFSKFQPILPPDGYNIKYYTPGDEIEWSQIEYECREFDSADDALAAFKERYSDCPEKLKDGLFFILSPDGKYCGTCMAWTDPDGDSEVNALHWLAVRPSARGLGLSGILISEVIKNLGKSEPIYLHTQTWSYKAVCIYHSFGFRLLKSKSFFRYTNEYKKSLEIIRPKIGEERYELLISDSE